MHADPGDGVVNGTRYNVGNGTIKLPRRGVSTTTLLSPASSALYPDRRSIWGVSYACM